MTDVPPGLSWSDDSTPGIRRRRAGRRFVYLGVRGGRVTDEATLTRVKALAVPPPGPTCGSAPTRAAISRRPAATPAAASSTATTPTFELIVTRRSSSGSVRVRFGAARDPAPGRGRHRAAGRAEGEGRSRSSCACSNGRSSGSATRSTPARTFVRADDAARPAREVHEQRAAAWCSKASTASRRTSTVQDKKLAQGRQAVPGPSRPGAVPVRRRRRQLRPISVDRRQSVSARH